MAITIESRSNTWKNNYRADTNGTSLQGFTKKISIKELESILGQPEYGVDDKVNIEWTIEFADGVVATIYLYKDYSDMYDTYELKRTFHIGGHSKNVVSRINRILRK